RGQAAAQRVIHPQNSSYCLWAAERGHVGRPPFAYPSTHSPVHPRSLLTEPFRAVNWPAGWTSHGWPAVAAWLLDLDVVEVGVPAVGAGDGHRAAGIRPAGLDRGDLPRGHARLDWCLPVAAQG